MRRHLQTTIVAMGLVLTVSFEARGDMFGGDIVVLSQILAQTVQELTQLKAMLQNGKDTLGLLQDVNRGINDSLRMADTLGLRIDPGLYRDLRKVDQALSTVEQLYGRPIDSLIANVQRNTDQTVAEAISFNNDLNEYARNVDNVGEQIKSFSHSVSPGGATKLTAESVGVLIHVADQQLRATGQSLKLQAQAMAIQNKREKDLTEQYVKEGRALQERMTSMAATFDVPRF
jgi:hypothetical protein